MIMIRSWEGGRMRLWRAWFTAVAVLRPACTRQRTYGWMVLVLLGVSLRLDLAGVTSFVRALGLAPTAYRRLLHVVHSPALQLERLTALWTRWWRDAFPAFTVGAARSDRPHALRPQGAQDRREPRLAVDVRDEERLLRLPGDAGGGFGDRQVDPGDRRGVEGGDHVQVHDVRGRLVQDDRHAVIRGRWQPMQTSACGYWTSPQAPHRLP